MSPLEYTRSLTMIPTMSVDLTMGPMLIGTICSAVILGVTYIQTFYYFTSYPKDSWCLKSLVICTVVLDTVHMSVILHSVYYRLITNFNNPYAVDRLIWSGLMEVCTAMTAFLVQSNFTLRVWRLSKSYLLTAIIFSTMLANAGCAIAWLVLSMQMKTVVALRHPLTRLIISINAISAATDLLITGSLVVLLRNIRTGFKRSNTMINQMVLFVVNTGALTSCVAIAVLVSILTFPNTLIYVIFSLCIGRFYVNSLLATLNARNHMRALGQLHNAGCIPISGVTHSSFNSNGNTQTNVLARMETRQEWDGLDDHKQDHDGVVTQKPLPV